MFDRMRLIFSLASGDQDPTHKSRVSMVTSEIILNLFNAAQARKVFSNPAYADAVVPLTLNPVTH